ncbi:MAG: NnrS family protein, partial [Burkholderiaceae bacterium]
MKLPSIPLRPDATGSTPTVRGLPLLRLGFRPFYLGAALFAALAIPWWA